jgi:hypothetical protein
MQLVGTNPSVEAWRSERLLQKLRETATLTASARNGLVWCFRQLHEGRRRPERQREKSNPNGRRKCQSGLTKNDLVKSVGDPRQNGGPQNGGRQIDSQVNQSR